MSLLPNVTRDGMAATVSCLLVLVWLKFNLFIKKFIYMIHTFQSLSHRKHTACHTQPPVNAVCCVKHRNVTKIREFEYLNTW